MHSKVSPTNRGDIIDFLTKSCITDFFPDSFIAFHLLTKMVLDIDFLNVNCHNYLDLLYDETCLNTLLIGGSVFLPLARRPFRSWICLQKTTFHHHHRGSTGAPTPLYTRS